MTEPAALRLQVAALTHEGRTRYVNEDCIAVGGWVRSEPMTRVRMFTRDLETPCLCLVADGMGGHPAGDVASRIAVERLTDAFPAAGGDADWLRVLLAINHALFDAMKNVPELTGMGTTVAGVCVSATEVVVFNVGDSRVYSVSEGRLRQVSTDDAQLELAPYLPFDFARRALTQCLGGYPGSPEIEPHVVRSPAQPGNAWLVCSDGLSDMIDALAMEACLVADPGETVRNLFDRAMDAGGADNISVILVRIEPDA